MNYELAKELMCSKCGLSPRHGPYWCKSCLKTKNQRCYQNKREAYIAKALEWKKNNRDKVLLSKRRSNRALRTAALDAYGWLCKCCGQTEEKFLGIDHIEGGGGKHRKEIGSSHIYSWLKKHSYPQGFQTLCHNCNMAKGFYGACPHTI